MNTLLKIDSNRKIPCTIIPELKINRDKYEEFVHTLINSDFLIRITEKTGLKWDDSSIKIKYSKEANFKNLDTILVDYDRGSRAVSSAIHESFHLMLRQYKWIENPTVKSMTHKYPELLNSPNGVAYKMEQMFAYLLQNEIYQEIAKDLNFDASKDYWDMQFIIESFIPREFNSPFLTKLSLTIIKVWNSSDRSNDIFKLIDEVDRILME